MAAPAAQYYAPGWMRFARDSYGTGWGKYPLKNLCIPTSHDSGAYNLTWGTWAGTKANVQTHSKTIYEQLQLGVRIFDIRPTLVAGFPWSCGHGTDTMPETMKGTMGWQGALGATLKEVVDDFNKFLEGKEEVGFLDVHDVIRVDSGDIDWNTWVKAGASTDEWAALINILKRIKYLYRKENAAYPDKSFLEYCLEDLTNDKEKKAAVIVVLAGHPNSQLLYDVGLWPSSTPSGTGYLGFKDPKEFLTRMQGDGEAVISTILQGHVNSIEDLARKKHAEALPWFPQQLAIEAQDIEDARIVSMDFIENLDRLTLCLAFCHLRHNLAQGIQGPVIYYCAHHVHHPDIVVPMREAIDQRKTYDVMNIFNIEGDPFPGMSKCCVVFYLQDGYFKG